MKPIFVYDEGIDLWEQAGISGDSRIATITVVQRDIDSLGHTWLNFLPILLTFLPNVFRWFTSGSPFVGSKVQELKLMKQLTEGFSAKDVLKKNDATGVYSLVKDETNEIKQLLLNTITHYRYSSLVFCTKSLLPQTVLGCFQNAESGIVSENISSVFDNDLEIVLCRVYDDSETHVAMQFIGNDSQIEIIKSELSSAGFEQVCNEEVTNIINS